MKYAHLGRSGLRVSRLALGTMNFGFTADESTSFEILDAAVEKGINFIDTADVYGGPQSPDMAQGYGTSEDIIGRWLKRGGRREDIVLATKAYQPMGLGPNDRRLSAFHIRRACEASLRRLQTDHIDLYQMHHVDRATPWEEIWQAMEQLVREGKITYVGSSNFAAWDIATAQSIAQSRLPRARLRTEPLQPCDTRSRTRAGASTPVLRHRSDPVEPARRRAARRHVHGRGHRAPRRPHRAGASPRTRQAARRVSKAVRGPRARPCRGRPRLAAAPAGRTCHHHRSAHPVATGIQRARGRHRTRHRHPGGARLDLARPRRSTTGVRLVGPRTNAARPPRGRREQAIRSEWPNAESAPETRAHTGGPECHQSPAQRPMSPSPGRGHGRRGAEAIISRAGERPSTRTPASPIGVEGGAS
jgi:hypothetical protein